MATFPQAGSLDCSAYRSHTRKFMAVAAILAIAGMNATASSGATTGVALTPSAPTAVGVGGHLTFRARMTGSTRDTARWSVDGIAGGNTTVGTISAAGVYTCPRVSSPAVHTITATSVASPGVSASVRILTTAGNTLYNAKTGYRATGNGSTDDTAAIMSALRAAAGNICYLPAGTYKVNPTANDRGTCALQIPANTCLFLASGATLSSTTQSTSGAYRVVLMGADRCSMVGGAIIGDRVGRKLPTYINYVGTDFENGDGIDIANGTGCVVLGVGISDCSSDGIYVFNGASDWTISDVTTKANRRNGISDTGGNNGLIQYCSLTNSYGQDPAVGIDLEPAGSGTGSYTVSQIQILHCSITGNHGGGINGGSPHASTDHVSIRHCTITGNGGGGGGFGIYVNDSASYFTISNNTVSNNVAGPNAAGIRLDSDSHMTISDNIVQNNHGYGIFLHSLPGSFCSGNTVTGNTSGQIYSDGSASVGTNTTH